MSISKVIGFLALTTSLNALALGNGLYFHKQSLLMQSNSSNHQALKLRADGSLRSQEMRFFDQKLNHKAQSSKTFKQRYFVDSQYAESAESPVFYIICGEWNCAGTGSYGFVENLAKKFKGHLVALEHRYYGESLPTSNLTADALKYLNLESAIADLARFQKFMMEDQGFKGKWISFGGSYAGTLSAFYREKHPELVVGALASSAPVFMKNEFSEYDAHVAKVINKTSCGDQVREAVKLIEDKMESKEGALEVKKLFKATDIKNNKDFLYVVADMLAAAVQYGRDKLFCTSLSSESDLIKGYAKGGLAVLDAMGTTPFEISLAVAEREKVTAADNMRQWMWQSCRQFGWFQVANGQGADTSRSSEIDLKYHEEVCQRLYKTSMSTDGALNANYYFTLFKPRTSNIIFTNGSNDPWLNLSVTERTRESNAEFDLFMMDGAAHCNDLKAVTSFPSVLAAQGKMEGIVKDWLK
jgi:hypothetical protein